MNIEIINQLSAIAPPPKKKLRYRSTMGARDRIAELEAQLGLTSSAPIWNVMQANLRIDALEGLLSAKSSAATLPPVPPDAPVAPQRIADGLTGRERFNASCALAAAAKPKSQKNPNLKGQEKFVAAARIGSAPPQVVPADPSPVPANLRGRERFKAALAKRSTK